MSDRRLDRLSWDDLRVFLTCADSLSIRNAARVLRSSPATVARSVERVEEALGKKIFLRQREGIALTPQGKVLAESARSMHRSLCELERSRAALDLNERGEVVIAVTEGLGSYWVMPRLIELQHQQPKTTISLFCAMESVNVLNLEADVAIQFVKPDSPDLVVKKLGRLHIYPFAAQSYLDIYGVPRSYEDIVNHRLIEQVAPQIDQSALARYFRLSKPDEVIGVRTNSSTAHLYAIERGAGIGGLPTFALVLGAPVVPVDIGPGYGIDIWLTYHPVIRQSRHKAATIDWLKNMFNPVIFPWFRDDFIHPIKLKEIAPAQALLNNGIGYLAVDPHPCSSPTFEFRQASGSGHTDGN